MALNLMLQGTMSNAGKSLLAAALCRIFRQDGYRVAPFKSQNMALNSFITAEGGEMGRAQVVQAEAAGIAPDVRMNPILLKPTTDSGSQVIVNGQVVGNMRATEYYRRKREFLPAVTAAYESLAAEYDVIVIEGAGSPAEINLKQDDFVNMGLAKLVDAPVLLIGDIDRGGVFAQLYGTIALLEPDERTRVKGTIVNKFRGDRAILEPGLRQLEPGGRRSWPNTFRDNNAPLRKGIANCRLHPRRYGRLRRGCRSRLLYRRPHRYMRSQRNGRGLRQARGGRKLPRRAAVRHR